MNETKQSVNPPSDHARREALHRDLMTLKAEREVLREQLKGVESHSWGLSVGQIWALYPQVLERELKTSAEHLRATIAKKDEAIVELAAQLDAALADALRWRVLNHIGGLVIETRQTPTGGYTSTIRLDACAPAHLEAHTGELRWLSRAEAERGHHDQCIRLWGVVLAALPPLPEAMPTALTENQRVFLQSLGLGLPRHLDELGDDALDLLREHEPELRAQIDAEGLVIDGTFPGPPWAQRAHHDLTMLIRALEARVEAQR